MKTTLNDILAIPVNSETLLKNVKERLLPTYNKEVTKLRFLAEQQPEWRAQVIKKADEALEHRYVLPSTGGQPYFVGNPPRWFDNPLNDNEFVWTLNRHYHLVPLTQAYHITGDKKYAECAVSDLLEWIESCPVPELTTDIDLAQPRFKSPNPWRLLEIGIRMATTWYALLVNLIGTECFTAEVMERFAISVYEQACVLREISPIFGPNADHNHFMHEMYGLLSACALMPELKGAEQRQNFAIHQLSRCMNNIFTPDGGLVEATPHYHDICLRMVLECITLANNNGIKLTDEFYDGARRAARYSAFGIKPNGLRAALGDSNMIADWIAKLTALYFGVFGELGVYENVVGLLTEDEQKACLQEYQLEHGDSTEFEQALKSAKSSDDMDYHYDKNIGEVFYRTGWGRDDTYFMFSCITPVPNGHSHIDPMTFDLNMSGVSVVADPGRYTYADTDMRRLLKTPEHHATLLFGQRHPFEYINNWVYGPQKDGYVNRIYTDGLFGAEAIHYNYEPAMHKRLVFTPEKDVFVVLDQVFNPDRERIDIYYPVGGTDAVLDPQRSCVCIGGKVNMSFGDEFEAQLLDGYCSPISDVREPIKRVNLTHLKPDSDRHDYLTVFSAKGQATELTVDSDGECVIIGFVIDGQKYRFSYCYGEKLEKL